MRSIAEGRALVVEHGFLSGLLSGDVLVSSPELRCVSGRVLSEESTLVVSHRSLVLET